jgi:NDP-sugar pyrophosphorylase family protein
VRDSVVLPGARLEPGAEVYHSIVGSGSTVGAKAVLRDLCVLGDGVEVAAGTELAAARLPDGG